MIQHNIVFLPSGKTGQVKRGITLLAAAQILNEGIESVCGGNATCGKCRVSIIDGKIHDFNIISGMSHLSPITEEEKRISNRLQMKPDERLACQAKILGDVAVFVPEESRVGKLVICKAAGKRIINIDPAVRNYFIKLTPPGLDDPTGDWDRLNSALARQFNLKKISIDFHTFKSLSGILRKENWEITVTIRDISEVINVKSGHNEQLYGLAIDVGTTSVAGYLCNLANGEIIATESMINPQVKYGEDVMTRIAYSQNHPDGLMEMNREIISGLNRLATDLAIKTGILPSDISEAVLVGNTAMHHILLNLDVEPLGRVPFAPSINRSVDVKSRELGLDILPAANVHVLPIEAGFVGADNVGVLIAEEPYNQDDMLLIIDIGTNGELVLGNRKQLLSTSCATGPAFEGANIKFGMRATPGAIDKIRIDKKTRDVRFTVIGKSGWNTDVPKNTMQAKGICGSGIIDAVAEMLGAGIIKKNGSMDKSLDSPRMKTDSSGKAAFVIAHAYETEIGRDITITQQDVRAIQLAKAALYSGARMMMSRLGISLPDKVVLAGAFGSVIDKKRALLIGMFSDCGIENVYSVGNAAGDGARIALLNKAKRVEAERIARDVEYIELTAEPGFQEAFVQATQFIIEN